MRNLILLFFFFNFNFCFGQNLVPNPSFEDTVSCPQSLGDFKAANWYVVENNPAYFNACNTLSISNSCSVPQNLMTYRIAASGIAYCGIINYISWANNTREKITAKLLDTLIIGKTYIVSFKISSINSWRYSFQNGASNNVGFLFSTNQFSTTNIPPTSNFCHFKADSIIKDTVGWEMVIGSFIADSSYLYLTIGNFFNDIHTDTFRYYYLASNTHALRCYTFIDDINVSYDSTQDVGFSTISAYNFSVYPNPTNNEINIRTSNLPIEQIELFNAIGRKEFEIFHPPIQPVLKVDVADLKGGIYLLKIKGKKNSTTKKINIIHQ